MLNSKHIFLYLSHIYLKMLFGIKFKWQQSTETFLFFFSNLSDILFILSPISTAMFLLRLLKGPVLLLLFSH